MITFIDDNRGVYGIEPICKVLLIAPSTYHKHLAQQLNPGRLSARARRDKALKPEVAREFAENFAVYGVRKVRRQMTRDGFSVAGCTVERLMRDMGFPPMRELPRCCVAQHNQRIGQVIIQSRSKWRG